MRESAPAGDTAECKRHQNRNQIFKKVSHFSAQFYENIISAQNILSK